MYKHYLLLKAYDFDDIRFKLLEAEKNGKSYLLDYVKLAFESSNNDEIITRDQIELYEKENTNNFIDILLKYNLLEKVNDNYKITFYKDRVCLVNENYDRDRHSLKYKEWRKSVFERDNYTCQICGKKGYLEAHHIIRWVDSEEGRFDIKNGITLCKTCHRQLHKGMK